MRRFVVVLAAVLLVLAVVVVVADRVVHARVEAELTEGVGDHVEVDGDHEVAVHGVPFLTQALAGRLDHVSLTADGVRHEGLTLVDVEGEAWGVSTTAPHTADRVEAAATVPLSTVQEQVDAAGLGTDLTVGVEGDLVELGTELFGAEVVLRADPVVEAGAIHLQVVEVALGSRTVDLADVGLGADQRSVEVPLDGLPDGLAVSDVETVGDGVRVGLTGEDVVLQGAEG